MRAFKHPPIGVLIAVALLLAVAAINKPARNDRDWYPYLKNTTDVTLNADGFAVKPVTDWRYDAKDAVSKSYTQAAYRYDQLKKVWFLLEPQPGMEEQAAHTFLLFEFDDGHLLGVTIEARREEGEEYSAWNGLWNAFELSYLWGTPADLLPRRAVMLGHRVYMYPLQIKDSAEREVLQRLLERTEALETRPRYYNTLTSNCTNELAKVTHMKWDKSFVLTGNADNHLFSLSLIPGENFVAVEQRGDVTAFIKDKNGMENFDGALLAEMRVRWGKDAD